jgi:hypothetical protein
MTAQNDTMIAIYITIFEIRYGKMSNQWNEPNLLFFTILNEQVNELALYCSKVRWNGCAQRAEYE